MQVQLAELSRWLCANLPWRFSVGLLDSSVAKKNRWNECHVGRNGSDFLSIIVPHCCQAHDQGEGSNSGIIMGAAHRSETCLVGCGRWGGAATESMN